MDDLTREAWERLHGLHGDDVPTVGRLGITMGLLHLAERALRQRGADDDYFTQAEVYMGAMWEAARSDFLRFGMPHLEAAWGFGSAPPCCLGELPRQKGARKVSITHRSLPCAKSRILSEIRRSMSGIHRSL